MLSWILLRPPARSKLTGSSAAFFCLFCLFFFMFFFLLVIVTFLRFVVSSSPIRITLESKQIVPFSSLYNSGNFSRDTSCDGVWPMKSSLHASYVAREQTRKCCKEKNLSFSRGICKFLAVFISLAVMGWFYLLTKRLIMPSCDEIEAKMASTWLHFRCRIPEV